MVFVFVVIAIIGLVNTLTQSSQSIVQNVFQKGNVILLFNKTL